MDRSQYLIDALRNIGQQPQGSAGGAAANLGATALMDMARRRGMAPQGMGQGVTMNPIQTQPDGSSIVPGQLGGGFMGGLPGLARMSRGG